MLGDGDDVGAGDFCNGDTAIGLVRSIQVDVIGSDASSDGNLQLLGLCETLGSEVTGVESASVSEELPIEEQTYGVVMIISASTSSWSNLEFSPSLSDVVTRVCPWDSSHGRIPSSFSVVPRSSGTWRGQQLSWLIRRRVTYFFGVLLAVVQYKEYLDLFTFPCQRSDAPKIVPQCKCPARYQWCWPPRERGEDRARKTAD